MLKLCFTLALILLYSFVYGQSVDFSLAEPQPDIVELYSGSSASGDIDGDGDNDLILSGITPSKITALYLNDGLGNFSEIIDTPFPNATSSILLLEDLDGDGDLDLFFSGNGTSIQEFTHIYLNNGQGEFSQATNPSLPQFSDGAADLGDVDGDGDIDILISAKDKEDMFLADIFLNDGDAIFTPLGSSNLNPIQFGNARFIDMENDGDLDVLIAGNSENNTAITALYINDGEENFVISTSFDFIQLNGDDLDVADTDNDGDFDILISGTTDLFEVHTILYLNDGEGIFTENTSSTLQNTFAGTNEFADFDNDGDLDVIIIGSQDGGLPNIFNIVYQNNGNNDFIPVDTLGGEYIAACVIADFTGDNLVDIIMQGFVDKTNAYWNTSTLTSTIDISESNALTIFPNPTSGNLTINIEAEYSGDLLSIYTMDGRLVYYQTGISTGSSKHQVDLENGTYYIVLNLGKSILSEKLVILR